MDSKVLLLCPNVGTRNDDGSPLNVITGDTYIGNWGEEMVRNNSDSKVVTEDDRRRRKVPTTGSDPTVRTDRTDCRKTSCEGLEKVTGTRDP